MAKDLPALNQVGDGKVVAAQFPRLIGVIIFRALLVAIAVLFSSLIIKIMSVEPHRIESAITFLYEMLLFGLVSAIVIVGLLHRKRWAAWLAVAFDVTVLTFAAIALFSEGIFELELVMLIFLVECIYLLRVLFATR